MKKRKIEGKSKKLEGFDEFPPFGNGGFIEKHNPFKKDGLNGKEKYE